MILKEVQRLRVLFRHQNLWHSECKCSPSHPLEVPLSTSSHYQDPGSKHNLSSETMKLPRPFLPSPLFSLEHIRSLFSAFSVLLWILEKDILVGDILVLKSTLVLSACQRVTEISSIMAGVFVAKYGELASETWLSSWPALATTLRRGRTTSWFGSIGMFWSCWTVLRLNSIMAAKEFSYFYIFFRL